MKKKKDAYLTFTKRMVIIILGVSILWISLSYILAFMGKDYIAESLSSTIVQVDIATILGYLCKAYFETKEAERLRLQEKKFDAKKEEIEKQEEIESQKQEDPISRYYAFDDSIDIDIK